MSLFPSNFLRCFQYFFFSPLLMSSHISFTMLVLNSCLFFRRRFRSSFLRQYIFSLILTAWGADRNVRPQSLISFFINWQSLSNHGWFLLFRCFCFLLGDLASVSVSLASIWATLCKSSFTSSIVAQSGLFRSLSTSILYFSEPSCSLNDAMVRSSQITFFGRFFICISGSLLRASFWPMFSVAMIGQWSESKGVYSPTLNCLMFWRFLCGAIR